MSDCVVDTLVRSKPFAELLDAPVEADGRWELNIIIPLESGTVRARAVLTNIGAHGMFCESTLLVFEQDGKSSPGSTTDVEGDITPDLAEFTVHIIDPISEFPPMDCAASSVQAGREYQGTWQMDCADPEGCGCSGMTGTLTLVRLQSTD